MELEGKRVLVTAGARGIGRAIAERFRELGARVLVTDVDAAAVAEAGDSGLLARVSDAADEEAVRRLVSEVEGGLGALDVLVNNAGIAGPTGPVDEIDSAEWARTFAVNTHSQFYCVKHALRLLRAGVEPSIINLSSAAGRLGMAGRSAYSSSKWAVVGFTKTLAIELGPEGIRANAICPGAVDGPRIRAVIEAKARMLQRPAEEITALYEDQSSMRRMVQAEDIADMAAFLAGPHSRNVNGQVMAVDGNTEKLY
jgi:NAD(P)-dependent dehydrogenase (short-subunit alcohol dehydrogenase family)